MKLIYTPKPGFAGPRVEWPARDHDEPDAKTAREKVASGFYREQKPPKTSAAEKEGEE